MCKACTPLSSLSWSLLSLMSFSVSFNLASGGFLAAAAAVAVASVMSDSVRPHRLQPTRSSVHGIFQARVLEWVAVAFSGFLGYSSLD